MLIFALAALMGAVAGLVLGGRFAALAEFRLRMPAVVWAALGMQVMLGLAPLRSLPEGLRFGFVVTSYAMVGAWLALNGITGRAVPMRAAFGLLAAGWLLNLVVMVPNGGMPVSAAALADSGAPPGLDVEEGHLWKHVELSASTELPALADVVAVPALGGAVSVGDVVMVVGLAAAVAAGMVGGSLRPNQMGVQASWWRPMRSPRGRRAVAREAALR